jgi:prepilin-type N-terminal cleavage/methylation domain-containing protein
VVTSRAGFTLTELVVAMALLAVGALGVVASGLVAAHSFTRAELQESTIRDGEAVLDSLLALPANSAGSQVVRHANLSWNAADSTGDITLTIVMPGRGLLRLVGRR